MVNLTLTVQEANALLALINIAVKSSGMEVAEAGVVLSKKIQQAAQSNPQVVSDVQKQVREKKAKKEEKAE